MIFMKTKKRNIGKLGWAVAFSYVACTALRLARFNTQAEVVDKKFFQGLPSPSAAAVVAGFIWMSVSNDLSGEDVRLIAIFVTFIAAGVMVSNIRYYSFKDVDFKGKVPFVTMLLLLLVFVFIILDPPQVLFGGFFIYMLSGFVITLWGIRQRRKLRKQEAEND